MPSTLGSRIRDERLKRRLSLRKTATTLNISPAFLSDIERDRRKPAAELVAKIAEFLDIPPEDLEALDPRLDQEVKQWFAEQPELAQLLKQLRNVADPANRLRSLIHPPTGATELLAPLIIFESELRAIAVEATAWETETGGDLFGLWEGLPIVYLATRAGPAAVRDHAHFKLDVDYLQRLSAALDREWGLRYFGDWHSHHRLGLRAPSTGDQSRIRRVATKNGFAAMAECIITFDEEDGSRSRPHVTVDGYLYQGTALDHPSLVPLIVVEGLSPIRQALIAAGEFPEQQLTSWTTLPMERLQLHEPLPRLSSQHPKLAHGVSRAVLERARHALALASGDQVECHSVTFGHILVAKASANDEHVAFAIGAEWPHTIHEVDWLDRRQGTAQPLDVDRAGLTALETARLTSVFTMVRQRRAVCAESPVR